MLAPIGQGLYGVACSGGADSLVLADIAIEVAGAANVVVLTIDHALAEGSERVADQVGAWARSRGAAGVTRRIHVERGPSLERAARDARYAALDALASELGLAATLVGHTARDQAETVLMRIVRGTGPAGLAAIPARRDGAVPYLRPFLAIDRSAIEAHVAARDLPVWEDPMNLDTSLTRVRVRRALLPLLRRENPQVDAALIRLATASAEWLAVIDQVAAPWARFPIDCRTLAAQPPAIVKRAVSLALEASGVGYDAAHLDAVAELIAKPTAGEQALDLPRHTLVRRYDVLDLTRPGTAATPLEIPEGFVIRPWAAGDRMRPARLRGRSRKLSDLYTDAKVPRSLRSAARVIARLSDGAIVWAEHIGIAHPSVLPPSERQKLSAIPD